MRRWASASRRSKSLHGQAGYDGGGDRLLLSRRDNRQQQISISPGPSVQRDIAAKHRCGPVARIVVLERAAAGPGGAERLEPARWPSAILVVLAAYRKRDAVAGGNDDARRPNLNVHLIHPIG